MIETIATELGPWIWWIAGLILLGLELLAPGVFLLWIGIAAMIVGAISFALWGDDNWPWQVQVTLFAILAVATSYLGKTWVSKSEDKTDQPLLNQRTQSLIGRTATLEEPIKNGRGRIKLDDTSWVIEGPDLEVGEKIKVVSSSSNRLTVEPV